MAGLWLFQSFRESRVVKTKKEYRNVYITDVKQQKVEGIWRGQKKTWQLRSAVSKEKISGVADLIEEQGKVVKVRKKPDMIQGKILRIMDKKLQIENYGFVSLDAELCVYHLKSDGIVTPGEVSELSVGESEAKYVAASGKICAVLLYERAEKTAKIRVILQNEKNHSYDFPNVCFSATTGYTVVAGKKKTHFDASEKQKLTAQNVKEHIVVIPDSGGKIRVESVNKQYGHPEYRGIFEIDLVDKALHIINELPLEEYLYSVVPSEMPTEYQKEALKAQAVCARSYAIKQMAGKRLAALGAHVDDIAQQLGVSKRTLYELFGDKEGLLYLAMDRYFEKKRIERAAVCAHARNVLEAMFMVLGGVMDNAEVIQRLLNNLRKFYPAVHDKMTREGTAKSRRDLQEMLEKGIADGLFVDTINLDLAISVLYYTASAITVRKDLILPAGMTEREAFVQIISNFFRGISTTKGLLLVDDYLKRYEPAKTVHRMQ